MIKEWSHESKPQSKLSVSILDNSWHRHLVQTTILIEGSTVQLSGTVGGDNKGSRGRYLPSKILLKIRRKKIFHSFDKESIKASPFLPHLSVSLMSWDEYFLFSMPSGHDVHAHSVNWNLMIVTKIKLFSFKFFFSGILL